MKMIKSPKTSLLLFIAASILTVSSCKKDDDDDNKQTDYVGIWATEETVPTDEGSITIKDVITFSENSFTEVAKVKDPSTDKWVDLLGRKGSINANTGEMNVTLTEAGATTVDIKGEPTGVLVYYKDGTSEFAELLLEMEMSKNYKAKYTISGNSLTLKADNNNNGSFDDEDEVHIFTKQ